ncbi:MAG: hypothetical protein NT067_04345, partial [Candidatus Diapherotrites archaeon]|nr:hypothetical protein [Candidatus Diapherotrites archaeon]
KKISKKFKRSWFASAAIVCFLFSLALVALAYFYPLAYGSLAQSSGELPPDLQPDAGDWLNFAVTAVYRVLLCSLLFSAISLFFVFTGSFLKEWLEKKKFSKYICLYVSVYACSLLASALFLFFFGWALQGTLYFLYS